LDKILSLNDNAKVLINLMLVLILFNFLFLLLILIVIRNKYKQLKGSFVEENKATIEAVVEQRIEAYFNAKKKDAVKRQKSSQIGESGELMKSQKLFADAEILLIENRDSRKGLDATPMVKKCNFKENRPVNADNHGWSPASSHKKHQNRDSNHAYSNQVPLKNHNKAMNGNS